MISVNIRYLRNILYSFVALFIVLNISSCSESSSTGTQTNFNPAVTLEASKSQVIADGSDSVTLTVTVKDSDGKPLARQPVLLSVPPTYHYVHAFPLLTDENGQLILVISPLMRPGNPLLVFNDDITATCNGVSSSTITISSWPVPPQIASSVTLVSDKTQALADGTDKVVFTATVKDSNGSPIPYQSIKFNVPSGLNRYLSPITTNAYGVATIQLSCPLSTMSDRVVDVTASSGTITSNTVSVTFAVPPPIIPASVTLYADKDHAIADSKDAITLTAIAKDGSGMAIPQQPISFGVSPAGISPFLSAIRSDANGLSVIHLTSRPASINDKTFNVTATSNGISSNTVVITYSAPPQVAPALVTLVSDKTTLIIDGIDQINFNITATDSSGNPSVGQVFSLNIPSGPYMYTSQLLTNTAGQASSTLHSVVRLPVLTTSTVKTITATINGTTSNAINITLTPP